MDGETIEVIVQTGNLTSPPSEDGSSHGEWQVTQEWKVSVSSSLNAEALTEVISKTCANGKRMWPHEISIHGEKPVVLRQGKESISALGIKTGSVLRFWNGKFVLGKK